MSHFLATSISEKSVYVSLLLDRAPSTLTVGSAFMHIYSNQPQKEQAT